MKTLLLTILFILSGCTVIDYDRTAGTFKYSAIGGKQLDSLEVIRGSDDEILVVLKQYKGENVADVAGKVAEGVVRGMK